MMSVSRLVYQNHIFLQHLEPRILEPLVQPVLFWQEKTLNGKDKLSRMTSVGNTTTARGVTSSDYFSLFYDTDTVSHVNEETT